MTLNNAMYIKKEKEPVSAEKIIRIISVIISAVSVLYLGSAAIAGNSWLPFIQLEAGTSEMTLAIIECMLAVIAVHVPMLIQKITKVRIPDYLSIFFYIFVLCATVLGEMFSLYYLIPVWDSILHFGSGMMLGLLGSLLVVTFLENKGCEKLISPMVIAIAAVCFALSIGVLWEVYEFSGDYFLGLNMQKTALQDGTGLVGQAAVMDTMKDLILDFLGAAAVAVIGCANVKKNRISF